ncbi:MAG TPA: winged helix-turn-helix domain-containing protein, partial [Pyrinomonadaceae bacterium]
MPHSNNLCYEFGPYVLNMVQRVLTRSGETISLTPKSTDLLALLVENAGQLLEKEELLKAIWPDTFVEEGNVSQAIF